MPKVQFRVTVSEYEVLKERSGGDLSGWLRGLAGLPPARRGRPKTSDVEAKGLANVAESLRRSEAERIAERAASPRRFKCGECGWKTSGPWHCQEHPEAPQEPIY